MQVIVHNNQLEKAIKDLKRKLNQEGLFAEVKERRFYDKPSVQRKKKRAKAAKRRRKTMNKFQPNSLCNLLSVLFFLVENYIVKRERLHFSTLIKNELKEPDSVEKPEPMIHQI